MERFILAENLRHLRERLEHAAEDERPGIRRRLLTVERELALYEASERGALDPWSGGDPALEAARARAVDWFNREFTRSSTLASLIDPRPGLMIINVNPIYAAATGVTPADIAGRPLFSRFPDSSEDPKANGVANLYASLRRVAQTGVTESMPVQRYDTRDPNDGSWVARYWRIENSAVKDDAGRVLYLLHLVAEVDAPAPN